MLQRSTNTANKTLNDMTQDMSAIEGLLTMKALKIILDSSIFKTEQTLNDEELKAIDLVDDFFNATPKGKEYHG